MEKYYKFFSQKKHQTPHCPGRVSIVQSEIRAKETDNYFCVCVCVSRRIRLISRSVIGDSLTIPNSTQVNFGFR